MLCLIKDFLSSWINFPCHRTTGWTRSFFYLYIILDFNSGTVSRNRRIPVLSSFHLAKHLPSSVRIVFYIFSNMSLSDDEWMYWIYYYNCLCSLFNILNFFYLHTCHTCYLFLMWYKWVMTCDPHLQVMWVISMGSVTLIFYFFFRCV